MTLSKGTQGERGERGTHGDQGARGERGAQGDVLTLSGIKAWLPIILIVVSLVVGWVTMGFQISNTQRDLARLDNDFRVHIADSVQQKYVYDTQYTAIQMQLAQIQTDLQYIKQRLNQATP